MKRILLPLIILYALSSGLACDFTVNLLDTYGDGWNGGAITIQVNGTTVLSNITLATGTGPQSYYFSANDGDVITITYTAGSWPYENWYTVVNDLNNTIITDGQGGVQPSGGTWSADCGPPPPPPSNDVPCGATPLTVNQVCQYSTFSTQWATDSGIPMPSCGWYNGGDVWFSAVVPASGRLTVDLGAQGMIEGDIAIYYGPDCNNLTELRCVASNWSVPMPSIKVFDTDGLAGQTVWIRVWEPGGDNLNTFDICAFETPPPPANTNPCDAVALAVDLTCNFTTFSNESAGLSTVGLPSCTWSTLVGDVWFTAVVPPSGRLEIETGFGDVTMGGLTIYYGTDCSSLTPADEVACTDDNWTMPQALVTSTMGLAGETVWIRFWSTTNSTVEGLFDICAFEPPPMIEVNTDLYTPEEIVTDILVTGCLSASNVVYCGDPEAIGYFSTGSISGFENGVILGSGPVNAISGTDDGDYVDYPCSTEPGIMADMSDIAADNGGSDMIYDMSVLEFDFVPSSDTTIFQFVFASEEYDAFECTSYNDVFAFFVSGPGISGPYEDNAINVALIPGTNIPITISTINNDPSCFDDYNMYYQDVVSSEQLRVEGMTVPISAVMAGLIPCETYHIKFVVSDAGDGILNTYVFFEGSSFTSGGEVSMENFSQIGASNEVYEGCTDYLVFTRIDTTDISDTLFIDFTISGTAVMGTDITDIPLPLYILPGELFDTVYYSGIIDGLAEGSEYVIFSVENGCPCSTSTTSDTIFVYDNFDLQPAISGDTIVCLGQSATITATVNASLDPNFITYNWSSGSGANSITVSPGTTTTYYVTIQDPCNQYEVLEHTVVVVPFIDASFTIDPDSVCINEATDITFTGASGPNAQFTWDFDGGNVLSGSGPGPYSVAWASSGTMTVGLNMNDNGCTGIGSETVVVSAIPSSSFTVAPVIVCAGNPVTVTYTGMAGPTATYTWNFGSANVISGSGEGPYQVNWTTEGNHTVTLEVKEFDCTSSITSVTVYNPAPLTVGFAASNISCPNGSPGQVNFDVNGGQEPYSYTWPAGVNPTNLQEGTYTVTVTDQLTCSETVTFTITAPNPFVYTPNFTDLNCYQDNSGSITVSLSGGTEPYQYTWLHNAQVIPVNDSTVSGLEAGTYYITITDDSLCTVVDTFVLSQPTLLTVSITNSDDVNCNGGSDGSATAQAVGGTAPYQYQWNDPLSQAAPAAFNLSAGTYSVIVTDQNGCTAGTNVTINEPLQMSSTITGTDVSCYGGSNGTVTVVASGGTIPYFYTWSPAQPNASTVTGLEAGTYFVTVRDVNGCTVLNSRTVDEPAQILFTTGTTDASCYGLSDGTATVTITGGGTVPFTFDWSTNEQEVNNSTSSITSSAGYYYVTMTDASGCSRNAMMFIDEPTEVIMELTPNQVICHGGSAKLHVSATGGHPGYTYYWSTGATGQSITVSPVETTSYSVYAIDADGCYSETQYVKVIVRNLFSIYLTSNYDTICPGEPVYITIHATGGLWPHCYVLNTGDTVNSPFLRYPYETQTYAVTVSDGCETPEESADILITVMPEPPNTFAPDSTIGCAPHTVYFNETNPHFGQSYYWNFGDPGSQNHDTLKNPNHTYYYPGTYTVMLRTTSQYGCINTVTMEQLIHIYENPSALFTNDPDVATILYPFITFTNLSIPSPVYKSYWIFGDGSDTVNTNNPVHEYLAPGEYYPELIVETEYGCIDRIIGSQIIIHDEYTLFVPTAFSPDGDNQNDIFSPKIFGLMEGTYHLYIYDRWGQMIYHTDDYGLDGNDNPVYGWDGRVYGGRIADTGVYTWLLIYKDKGDIDHIESGAVTVIR
ncbi:MAG: choice-of-anchor L domain-containing protein [Bacteroidetes bacterium]|nr:choice-of-anchor L domain-containing protein [Bacteroidota bacterium]